MAKQPTITTIASGFYSTSALNTNFENIRDQFDNTLSLDGSTPNAMAADFDLNGYDLLNGGAGDFTSLNLNGTLVTPTGVDPILSGVSSFSQTLLDDTTAADWLTTLGFTATLAELNTLDGLTATTAELNYTDGVTSNIQTQIDGKEDIDAEILRADTDDNVTAGYTATADNDGSKSTGTYTPDPAGGNLKYITNDGAFTLAAPTAAGDYTLVIQMTNGGSAGAVTVSGFSKQFGDSLTATSGDDFFLFIAKINGFTSLTVQALQ